ncbi:tetratricopeptide repeat protein [Sulfitobacter sp. D35]|uniref:tetratricopeptide repeat protein n=1 Tax=Sulfitobacter sp. D35 TaxID=3083252 RepID=UPI00296F9948|nr:tetratricopeptide repeat protein [Sulfitobacter sp. D35]MDW4499915.1 tetratricopeptide repeat protein [Sulfitobacter sp. D35]
MLAESVLSYLEANWGWAAGLAASIMGLTALAGLLNRQRKDEVALWLMGAHTEAGWAKSFTTLFDAVFGRHHLSLRCFLRSAAASLVAVVVIWLLMGSAETIGLRLQADLTLGTVLILGLAINVAADYASLLETRHLLAHMPRRWLAQAGVLILDLLFSAAIIWLAIFAYIRSPLHQGEIESFAEILGIFSIFSVFFYSTFLTSVWTWAYVASTWLMRAAKRLRLADWLDVEHRPILILSNLVGLVTFLGALAFSGPMTRDEEGLTAAERTLCSVFKGRVCLDVATLTPLEQAQLDFITLACEGGVTKECLERGLEIYEVDGESAARLWQAGCYGGDPSSCGRLGFLYQYGLGVTADTDRAANLFEISCDEADPIGCTNLGYLYERGEGRDQDTGLAAELYRQGCDGGNMVACTNLGRFYHYGLGLEADPSRAAALYRQGCDGGLPRGCNSLGILYDEGFGVAQDQTVAAELYRQACDADHATGCSNLGLLHMLGFGVERDESEARRNFEKACALGRQQACDWAKDSP